MTNTPDTYWRDLVKWLRECSNYRYTGGLDYYNITTSATTIERQAKEIERLKEALVNIEDMTSDTRLVDRLKEIEKCARVALEKSL